MFSTNFKKLGDESVMTTTKKYNNAKLGMCDPYSNKKCTLNINKECVGTISRKYTSTTFEECAYPQEVHSCYQQKVWYACFQEVPSTISKKCSRLILGECIMKEFKVFLILMTSCIISFNISNASVILFNELSQLIGAIDFQPCSHLKWLICIDSR